MTRAFNKPAITHAQQVDLLKSRGMIVDDVEEAQFYLAHLNYYRLCAYWLPFEEDHSTHRFKDGTHFNDVLKLYFFDRKLRLLVLDAVESVEVSVRTQWAHHLGRLHGPHAHLEEKLFNPHHWQRNHKSLTDEVNRADEIFIKHLKSTYSEPLPPVWAVCEVMSFGSLSRWYASLQPKSTRLAIAKTYQTSDDVLQSWLHHLSLVRNVCAHHSRLWNREFTIIPKLPRSKPSVLVQQQLRPNSRKIYNTLVILGFCMEIIASRQNWYLSVKDLILEHRVPVYMMGFPVDWLNQEIWQDKDS